MKLIDREPTPEMLRAMGAEVRGGSWSMRAIFNAAYDAAPEIQQEPIYAFRRKGQDAFCTCTFERYLDCEASTHLFEVAMFYPLPPDAQAESCCACK